MPWLYVAPALPEKGSTRAAHANISTAYRNGCSTAHSLVADRQAVPECQCLAAYCVRLLAMGVRHSRGQDAGRAVPVDWVLASGAGLPVLSCLSSGGGNNNIIIFHYILALPPACPQLLHITIPRLTQYLIRSSEAPSDPSRLLEPFPAKPFRLSFAK